MQQAISVTTLLVHFPIRATEHAEPLRCVCGWQWNINRSKGDLWLDWLDHLPRWGEDQFLPLTSSDYEWWQKLDSAFEVDPEILDTKFHEESPV